MEDPKGLIFHDLEETVAIIKSGQWLELIPLILNGTVNIYTIPRREGNTWVNYDEPINGTMLRCIHFITVKKNEFREARDVLNNYGVCPRNRGGLREEGRGACNSSDRGEGLIEGND